LADPVDLDARDRRGRTRAHEASVLSLAELEAIRLILRGGSVIDWYRLNLESDEEARAFLHLLGADPDDKEDQRRLIQLRDGAGAYLTDPLGYRLPPEMLSCSPFDLFAYASERRGRRRDRFFACLLLKAMHIRLHIEARELRYRLAVSQSAMAGLVKEKVDAFARGLSARRFPLVRYEGGEKSLTSLVTKLLVKAEHHAAAIHDRVRFRFVVERTSDLVPLLHEMTSRLLPFNYVVPGQTVNHLVNFAALVESHEAYRKRSNEFQVELGHEEQRASQLNEFSGPSFRVINFVVDVPIRVPDELLSKSDAPDLGRVMFGLAEFQITDETSAKENEAGDNNHERYKQRQVLQVRERLERGLRDMKLDEES
jgi:uncharacterized protein (TIGR04552 family)